MLVDDVKPERQIFKNLTLCYKNFNLECRVFSTPSFTPFNSQNSAAIPACFVLKLNKPMPMCVTLLREIQQLTELEIPELASSISSSSTTTTTTTTTHPLLSLIASHASNGKLEAGNNKGLFVVSLYSRFF